jgi:hypothetical protein
MQSGVALEKGGLREPASIQQRAEDPDLISHLLDDCSRRKRSRAIFSAR